MSLTAFEGPLFEVQRFRVVQPFTCERFLPETEFEDLGDAYEVEKDEKIILV